MIKIVSITSQGQITIPAEIRRALSLDRYHKAVVRTNKGKITVEPMTDILSLAARLKKKSIQKKEINQIIKLEEEILFQRKNNI